MVLEEEMKSLVEFLPHVAKGTAGAHIVGSTRHRKTDQSRPVGRQTVENRVFVRKVLHGGEDDSCKTGERDFATRLIVELNRRKGKPVKVELNE